MKLRKRIFDVFCTSLGLAILWPIFVVIAVLIKLDDRGPVFFRQERIGLNGKPFGMWKFRTMVTDAEKLGKQLTIGRDPRITRIGHLLRKSKLDELPQLVNVLVGEMSLVGPRPEVGHYVGLYTPEQQSVLELSPGITDPASICYRDEAEILAQASDPEATYINEIMPEKIRLNLEYAMQSSAVSDFMVIMQTLKRIF
jgi:lipopolysaccharide/colanic/teichoic acid biosynthesis glycosyltransferase